jgi:hypothetical protein
MYHHPTRAHFFLPFVSLLLFHLQFPHPFHLQFPPPLPDTMLRPTPVNSHFLA